MILLPGEMSGVITATQVDRDLVYHKREMKTREDEFVRVKQQLQAAMHEKVRTAMPVPP
jgi:hypothetical protein